MVWAHPSKAEDGYCLVKDTAPALFQVPRMKKREAKMRFDLKQRTERSLGPRAVRTKLGF